MAAPGLTQEPSEAETTQRELAATLRELRSLRESYYARRQSTAARIDRTRAEVTKLDGEVNELTAERDELDERARTTETELTDLTAENTKLDGELAASNEAIQRFAKDAKGLVEGGLPYRLQSRLAALDGVTAAPSARDAFGRLWSFFEEEMRIARSGETYSDEIDLGDGRQKHARFVRAGKLFLGFVTEDAADVGLWRQDRGWITDPTVVDPDAVRSAVEILDRRRAPEYVVLPVPVEADKP